MCMMYMGYTTRFIFALRYNKSVCCQLIVIVFFSCVRVENMPIRAHIKYFYRGFNLHIH